MKSNQLYTLLLSVNAKVGARHWSALLTVLLFLVCGHLKAQSLPLDSLDTYVEKALKEWKVPGLSITVVQNDSILVKKGYGVQQVGTRRKVNEHTLMAIGSNTKAFTAAALGLLVDEGKIKWDDPVIKYLPDFEMSDPFITKELNIRDLITHRVGVNSDYLYYGQPFDRYEVIKRLKYLSQDRSFRSSYFYSNNMFVVAGIVIEKVSGMTWEAFLQQRIFEPLGMHRTFGYIPPKSAGNIATPHRLKDGVVETVPHRSVDNSMATGAIYSSAADMAQWLRLQANRGVFNGKQFLSKEVMQEMHRPQMPYPGGSYGFGWGVEIYGCDTLLAHIGAIDGWNAAMTVLPGRKAGVFISVNREGVLLPVAFLLWINDKLLGRLAQDHLGIFLQRQKEKDSLAQEAVKELEAKCIPGTQPALALESYTGTYHNIAFGDLYIKMENKQLILERTKEWMADLQPCGDNRFLLRWRSGVFPNDIITFTTSVDGKVSAVELAGFGTMNRKGSVGP